jgi:hypothetical protein
VECELLSVLIIDHRQERIMARTEREKEDGKPLGDSGSGASGGGSIGNLPGGAATGGDARQGVRAPDAPLQNSDPRLERPAEEIDEAKRPTPMEANDYAKDDKSKGASSNEGDSANSTKPQTATEAALPSTIDKNPRPKE